MALVHTLVQGTKNERGFSGTGRLLGRILSALTSVYPKDQRFLNPEEWSDPRKLVRHYVQKRLFTTMTGFRRSHNEQWGKLYRVEEVHIDWHVPSDDEISLALVSRTWREFPSIRLLISLCFAAHPRGGHPACAYLARVFVESSNKEP